MHARHRSPAHGYRSSSTGTGWGASKISPETSGRGHGFYNSEYRSFNNRGFGRGQGHPTKSFQQPPQPPIRKGDLFMEAGRLAAEYLVSKGLLPPSVLSGKWQNGGLKKQVGDYQDFHQQDDLTQETRIPAHARLASVPSDAGSARRRYFDDFNSRVHMKGRRRGDYYRSYSSEWGREYGRRGSWSDRNEASPDMEREDDTASGHCEEQQVGKAIDEGMHSPGLSRAAESEEATDMEWGLEKFTGPDEMGSKASSSCVNKDEMNSGHSKRPDDLTSLTPENEAKGSHDSSKNEKQIAPDLPIQHTAAYDNPCGKSGSDLLALCRFVNVPTKTRSALVSRTSKVDQVPNNEDNSVSDIAYPQGLEVSVQDCNLNCSTNVVLTNASHDLKSAHSEVSEDVGELGPNYGVALEENVKSQSFSSGAFMHGSEQESSPGQSGSVRSTLAKERGEKRTAEESDVNKATKKLRECYPSLVTDSEGHLNLSDSSDNRMPSKEMRSSEDRQLIAAVTQDTLVDCCQFPENEGEQHVQYTQEKQLFPSSFKICDLNLMESSDMNDSHCNDPVPTYATIVTTQKEMPKIDVDLSISNSNISSQFARHTSDGKEIEVIDLENDSTTDDKAFNDPERKMDTAFTGTEGFPSNAQNASDIADVQDNYDGLMISEFLNTFSNCNSVTEDITSLQNEINLHNGEGNFGDDDSIYMSLGEIPLSFIPAWQQPTPKEYEKPF
uniref:Uncharacterized protein n=1 Tax=Rhizophora mucronata TaxID=61149 RepID=A0A2P2JJ13_RHIMU